MTEVTRYSTSKTPEKVFTFEIDWTRWGDPGTPTATVTVEEGGTGVTVSALTTSGQTTTSKISGGTIGSRSLIRYQPSGTGDSEPVYLRVTVVSP